MEKHRLLEDLLIDVSLWEEQYPNLSDKELREFDIINKKVSVLSDDDKMIDDIYENLGDIRILLGISAALTIEINTIQNSIAKENEIWRKAKGLEVILKLEAQKNRILKIARRKGAENDK